MKKFNIRINQLELRSCNSRLLSSGEHTIAEIVKWDKDSGDKEYCYTLAFWKERGRRYNLIFVAGRPFTVNKKDFWKLAQQGQLLLEKNKERNIK